MSGAEDDKENVDMNISHQSSGSNESKHESFLSLKSVTSCPATGAVIEIEHEERDLFFAEPQPRRLSKILPRGERSSSSCDSVGDVNESLNKYRQVI